MNPVASARRLLLSTSLLLLSGFIAPPSTEAQDAIVSPAQDDLVSAAYRVLKERGLEPLTKVSSFYTLAILNGNAKKAFSMIQTSESLQEKLTESEQIKTIAEVTQGLDEIDLIGFRFYSTSVVSLVYLVTTKQGPLCIRLNLYTSGGKAILKGVQMTTEWHEMDEILDSVSALPATLNLKLKLEELTAP